MIDTSYTGLVVRTKPRSYSLSLVTRDGGFATVDLELQGELIHATVVNEHKREYEGHFDELPNGFYAALPGNADDIFEVRVTTKGVVTGAISIVK